MREFVGYCSCCGVEVYCEDGFFNGLHVDGVLLCASCIGETKLEEDQQF
ncbi:hypothetical protein [Virgibacillus sp. MG-45]